MDYKKPWDIDIFFKEQFMYTEKEKNAIIGKFQAIAFCIFALINNSDSFEYKIDYYEVKVEDQANFMNENIILYYMKKPIFKLIGCNSGAWMAEPYCDPETTQAFCHLVDQKYNIVDQIYDEIKNDDFDDIESEDMIDFNDSPCNVELGDISDFDDDSDDIVSEDIIDFNDSPCNVELGDISDFYDDSDNIESEDMINFNDSPCNVELGDISDFDDDQGYVCTDDTTDTLHFIS